MTTDDLIEKLKEMRAAARRGDNMTAMAQLFWIIFDRGMENSGSNTVAIGRRAGVGGEEIADGRKYARYVTAKREVLRQWRP